MPERAEIFVQHKQVEYFIQSTTPQDRRLRALWVDPTKDEQAHASPHSRAHEGLVYALSPGDTLRRGQKKLPQGKKAAHHNDSDAHHPPRKVAGSSVDDTQPGFSIYPSHLTSDLSSSSFILIHAPFNPRSLILEFRDLIGNRLCVEVRLFLHVSTQIFSRSEWKNSICKVARDARGFKVAIAFDMGRYVLALLAHDLLFRVTWASALERLPSWQVSDVLVDWPGFLQDVAWWVERRRARARSRTGPAFLIIHSSEVFPGLGVYSLSEVFHRAGLQLSVSERGLFDNASRTARLCVAFRAFAADCQAKLWPFVKRYLFDFKFAVERSDRLFYGRNLYVYGKAQTWVCSRHGVLLDKAIRAKEEDVTDDVFEPGLVREPLLMPCDNLGHLIFGLPEWTHLQALWGVHLIPAQKTDPLTRLYRSFQSVQQTHLAKNYYDSLDGGQWNARHFKTTMFRFSTKEIDPSAPPTPRRCRKKGGAIVDDDDDEDVDVNAGAKKASRTYQAWSIIPATKVTADVRRHFVTLPESSRLAATLKNKISTTHMYTVGPMDFCGIARLERAQGQGSPVLFLCNDDPAAPAFYRHRRKYAQNHLKSHFPAALLRRVRKVVKKKGPSHKKKPGSTLSRRRPRSADQLALEEAQSYISRNM